MSRPYRPPPVSRASATTLCQKCLKRGHYSYECKEQRQERPYTARPSRTQQLLNPKLAPKLNSDVPNELMKRAGVADAVLAKNAEARKKERAASPRSRRSRSRSSSYSVSTISTRDSRSKSRSRSLSRSASPHRSDRKPSKYRDEPLHKSLKRRLSTRSPSRSPSDRSDAHNDTRNTRRRMSSYSPKPRGRERRRQHDRSESVDSRADNRSRSRNGRQSPAGKRRTLRSRSGQCRSLSRSRSPYRGGKLGKEQARYSPPRRNDGGGRANGFSNGGRNNGAQRKERSLSPYSKRLALTRGAA